MRRCGVMILVIIHGSGSPTVGWDMRAVGTG